MSDQGFDPQAPGPVPPSGQPVAPQYPVPPADPVLRPPAPAAAPQPQYPPQPEPAPAPAPAQQPAYSPQPAPQYAPQSAPTPQPAPQYAPQPGAYAPPQPQSQYAPPQGAAYGPPTAPPKKKGKAGLVIGIVAVLLLCGIVSCGAIGLGLFGRGSDKTSIGQAEQHFSAALTAVETADASISKLKSGSSATQISGVVTETNASLRTARDEVVAAKALADGWKDSAGKTDYQAGLTSANDALDAMAGLVAYLDTASGMVAKSKKATNEANMGMDALNAAVSAGNRSSYATQRAKALLAAGHYAKAALLFNEAHKLDKSAGFDKAAHYCDLRAKQASILVRMASEGQSHRISAYNADVKRMNTAGHAAEKIGAPAIVSDTSWAEKRLSALGKQITDAATKADTMRTKALKELNYTP